MAPTSRKLRCNEFELGFPVVRWLGICQRSPLEFLCFENIVDGTYRKMLLILTIEIDSNTIKIDLG